MLRAAAYHFRQGGGRQVLYRVGARAARPFYRSYSVDVYRSPPLDPPPAPTHRDDLSIGLITFRELEAARHFKTVTYPELIRKRFDDGHRCIAIHLDGELAHVAWLTVGRLPVDRGIPDIVDERIGGAFDMFTFEQFRGRGCMTEAVREICRTAHGLGLSRVVTLIHPGNRPSIAAFARQGFQRLGPLTYRRILGRSRFNYPAL